MNTASPTIEQTGYRRISPLNGLHIYAVCVACATFLLVLAGGLVTSTGSALAVPDWPLANGQFFPRMEGGVLYEHGHRMIAGTVGLLTFALAAMLWRRGPVLRALGLCASAVVCLQAILGGVTVLYRLPVPVSVAHACLGQVFFSLMVSIAVLTHPSLSATATPRRGGLTKLQRLGLLTVGFIFLQLIAGATVRHTGRFMHAHFLGAFLVTVHVPLLARRVFRECADTPGLITLAAVLPALLVVQLILGYISWRTGPVITTTAHVGIGALLLAGSVVITLLAFRFSTPSPLVGEGRDEGAH